MIEIRHLTPGRFGESVLEVRMTRGVQSYPPAFKALLAGFALLCLTVAGAFAVVGAVPVLGFAGLELVLLFVLLRLSFRRAATEEGVSVAGDATIVRRDGAEAARLQSYWLTIEPNDWENRGLVLRSRGQSIAVGAGLAAAEVKDLAAAMREALHRLKTIPMAGRENCNAIDTL